MKNKMSFFELKPKTKTKTLKNVLQTTFQGYSIVLVLVPSFSLKGILIAFFIFHFSIFNLQSISAQVGSTRNVLAVGVTGGMDMSFVDFSPRIKQTLQPGFTGGLVVRYTTERYFAMLCAAQLEVNYTQRGWREDIDDGSGNTYSCTTTYIEVPFLAHLSFGSEGRGTQFFLNAGPAIGWYLNSTEQYGYTAGQPWDVSARPNHVTAQYGHAVERPFEYGITAGLGVELLTAIGHFTLEGRYFFGLSDMYGNSKADPFGRSANNTISARIAYLIDLTH